MTAVVLSSNWKYSNIKDSKLISSPQNIRQNTKPNKKGKKYASSQSLYGNIIEFFQYV